MQPEFGLIVPASDERPSWGARRADALGRIAESFLQHGAEALNPGDRPAFPRKRAAKRYRADYGKTPRCDLRRVLRVGADARKLVGLEAGIFS